MKWNIIRLLIAPSGCLQTFGVTSPLVRLTNKLILMTSPSMTIKQLKQKVEMEFAEIFPREEPYFVGKIDDTSGYTLPADSLVGDHFKQGDNLVVWPRADYEDFPHTYSKESANDLVHTLKNVHYSLVSKISDSYIQEYTDKVELLNTVLPLGLSEDIPTIQNI